MALSLEAALTLKYFRTVKTSLNIKYREPKTIVASKKAPITYPMR